MGRRTILCWHSRNSPLDWVGETVAIIGSGPSAAEENLEQLRGRCKVIVTNRSWELAPWADALYATDSQFWFYYKGVSEFKGRKFTSSPVSAEKYQLDQVLTIGNNSGLRAMQLAEILLSRRFLLIGFDMHVKQGVHWHEPHGGQMRNPGTGEMRMWLDEMAIEGPKFTERRVEVINCSLDSAISCFRKMPLQEALDVGIQNRADQPRPHAVC